MIVQTDPRAPRVVLVGPPGAGKSTIGRKLAKELGVELFDTDAGIESDTGRTIPEIFATDGEPEFRKIEERVVRRAILNERGVVSLGGGSVLSADTRALLRGRTVVYLEISVAEGLRRTGASSQRPLLNGADPGAKYRELMRKRRPLYREVASIRVRTDGRSPGRVVRMILVKLGVEPSTPDPVAAETTAAATPSGNSRSRARRRARARAAAARRADPAGAGADATETTEKTGVPAESATEATKSSRRRGRRRSRRTATGTNGAPPSDSADLPNDSRTPAAPRDTAESGAHPRGRRTRRSGRAGSPENSSPGAELGTTDNPASAAPAGSPAHQSQPVGESGEAGTESGRRASRRPRRARRAAGAPSGVDSAGAEAEAPTRAARRAPGASNDSAGAPATAAPAAGPTGKAADSTTSSGRARRGRSRRGRGRAQDPSARTESEQTT